MFKSRVFPTNAHFHVPLGRPNNFGIAVNLQENGLSKSACVGVKLPTLPRHNVNTIPKKQLKHFCIYIEIDFIVKCEQSLVDERDMSYMV